MIVDVMFSIPEPDGGARILDDVSFSADMASFTAPQAEELRPKIAYAIRQLYRLDDRCEDTIRIIRKEKTR